MRTIFAADTWLLLWIQENMRTPWLTAVLTRITHLGDAGVVWILLSAALLIFVKTRRSGICASVSLAAVYVVNDLVLKNIFERLRPFEASDAVTALIAHPGGASFPSGHTASAFAVAAALVLSHAPRYVSVPASVLALLIAFSRVYLGVHYPTDVIAGAAVGIAVGAITAWAVKKVKHESF